MATTRLWSICSRLDLVVKYVGNKEKTTTDEDIQTLRKVLTYAENDYKTEEKKYVTTAFDKVMTSDLINDIIKYEIAY